MSFVRQLGVLDAASKDKVLFIGDRIIDEYHYVSALGKSPKEHLISVAYEDQEIFEGGVVAASNHAKTFCGQIAVLSGSTAVRKVRYVDRLYLRKLFEVHFNEPPEHLEIPDLSEVDTVVVTDFGHGLITDDIVKIIDGLPNYTAINAQTNSANVGFNLITKYQRANYVVIDEPEARLAAQDRTGKIEDVIKKLVTGKDYEKIIVTQGSRGAIGYDHLGIFYSRPAMTQKVVDTMGAGDAFFSVTAPLAKYCRIEDLLAIGCAAGALKTQIVGHRASVTKNDLRAYLMELDK